MYMECLRLSDIQRSFSLHIPHAFFAELCFFFFYHACFLGGVGVVAGGVGVVAGGGWGRLAETSLLQFDSRHCLESSFAHRNLCLG